MMECPWWIHQLDVQYLDGGDPEPTHFTDTSDDDKDEYSCRKNWVTVLRRPSHLWATSSTLVNCWQRKTESKQLVCLVGPTPVIISGAGSTKRHIYRVKVKIHQIYITENSVLQVDTKSQRGIQRHHHQLLPHDVVRSPRKLYCLNTHTSDMS